MATKPTLVLTYEVHDHPQRVFDVLTQPAHLNRYFTSGATVDLQVGGRWQNADGESGKYLKVAVPRQLIYTYTHSRLGFESEIDLTLKPSHPLDWTQLRLVHKGLDPQKVTPESDAWIQARWKFLAASLQGYLRREGSKSFADWQARQTPVYAQRP